MIKRIFIVLAVTLALTGAAQAAPDPVATNSVTLVGHDGSNFRYAISIAAASAAAAPDCHGKAVITLCGRHVVGVTGLPATWDTTSVTITGAPVGTSHVTVRTDQPMNANPVAWLITTNDGRRYSGTTSGPTCGPNAVALTQLNARSIGIMGWLAALLREF